MQACFALLCALCLPSLGAYAADVNNITSTNSTTTTNTTTTTPTTTITNSSTTTNTTMSMTYTTTLVNVTSTNFSNTTAEPGMASSSTATTITSTTMVTTTSTTDPNATTTTDPNATTTTTATTITVDPNATMTPTTGTTSTPENMTINETSNETMIILMIDYNTTSTTSTTSTSTGPTTVGPTTSYNGTVTSTKYVEYYFGETTTTTTTLPQPCDTPVDPYGNYTLNHDPYNLSSLGQNSSWTLQCYDGYFPTGGLILAKCLGNGVLRPAGQCMLSGCLRSKAVPSGTNCRASMEEGESCSVLCPGEGEEVLGYYTCIRAELWGNPRCMKVEAQFWVIAWVLPKIIGGFDIQGKLKASMNMTNETMAAFQVNVSRSLTDCLENIRQPDFEECEVEHLQETDMGESDEELETKTHLWAVNYELIIWDVNTLGVNLERLTDLMSPESEMYECFEKELTMRANIANMELIPTNIPITYNETIVAPDTEVGGAPPRGKHGRLVLFLLMAPAILSQLLGDQPSE